MRRGIIKQETTAWTSILLQGSRSPHELIMLFLFGVVHVNTHHILGFGMVLEDPKLLGPPVSPSAQVSLHLGHAVQMGRCPGTLWDLLLNICSYLEG